MMVLTYNSDKKSRFYTMVRPPLEPLGRQEIYTQSTTEHMDYVKGGHVEHYV